jgi:predicted MFS family arabinose efflux permease
MALICGFILNFVKFPYGYQIVFLMGALGAAMSSLALWKIHPPVEQSRDSDILFPKNFWGKEERAEKENPSIVTVFNRMLNLDVLRSPYLRTLMLLFGFHLTQYLAIPIFPIFLVNTIHLSDQFISFGQSLFNLSVFNGSLMHAKIAGRLGNKRAVGFGMILLAFYPFILAQAKGLPLYLVASLVGGFAWSVAGGALYNYLLERVPEAKRASYLAWFNVFAYTGILIGSLCGPIISNVIGIVAALFLFAGFRFLSGLSILRWG